MSNNEILKDIVKSMISEEDIKNEIHDQVSTQVTDLLGSYEIKNAIHNVAVEMIHEKGEEWIREMVENVINSPVRLDDGWGDVKEMGTFEDFARNSLRRQCLDQWNLERKVRDMVNEKLKKIATDIVSKHLKEDLANEVLGKLAEEVKVKK